jgi:hypothetical protein
MTMTLPGCAADGNSSPINEGKVYAAGAKVEGFGDLKLIGSNQLTQTLALNDLKKEHLYGIGMPEGLNKELLILDGQAFGASFQELRYTVQPLPADQKVSFFVYANVAKWNEIPLPKTVRTFGDLEGALPELLDQAGIDPSQTTAFRLDAEVDGLKWFVVNGMGNGLPDYQSSFFRNRFLGGIDQTSIESFGIYSPDKQGSWTSPPTKIHLHFRTKGPTPFVGHLDSDVFIKEGAVLYVPASEI